MKKRTNKVMLITGTSKGIGKFLAAYYVDKQYHVVGCSRSPNSFKSERYSHYQIDISYEKQVKEMILDIDNRFGRLDVLINNAGVASMNHVLLTPLSSVIKLLNINFVGTFLLCRESAKIMMRQKCGRIVNLTTIAVPLALEGEAIYASSKSAVETLTKILAKELAQFNITCNAVGPAPIETDLIRNVPKEKIKKIIGLLTIKHLGKFGDVANVIDFYIDPKSEFITGQIIYLGGV